MIGTKALKIPKSIEPAVFARTMVFMLIGASSSLSNDLLFLSNVIVTASMEVVPNKMLIAVNPGKMSIISTVCCDRKKNINAQAKGNIIPQLTLGGFK